MQSELLTRYQIPHWISGSECDVREKNVGAGLKDEIDSIVEKTNDQPVEIFTGQQVHGSRVEYAKPGSGKDYMVGRIFEETDGLLTDQEGVAMWVKFADCTPVVLYDVKRHVLSIMHSGWRGTAQKISEQALKQMEAMNCQAKDIIAYVGPSIGQDQYEVGPEVYQAFESFSNRDNFFYKKGEKYHLSMVEANASILRDCGIPSDQIEIEEEVTFGNPNLHSSREEGETYGLNGMLVMLPKKKF